MTNPPSEEPMWPSTNILLSHTLNKHSVPSDNSYEETAAWFWVMWNYPAPRPLNFHPNLSCVCYIPTPEHWNPSLCTEPPEVFRHRTHLTCAHKTLASASLSRWFPVCPTFPSFVITVKFFQVKCCCALGLGCVLEHKAAVCTPENTHKMSEAVSKLSTMTANRKTGTA